MYSGDLTAEPITALQDKVQPMLTHLTTLRKRMEQTGFGDKLVDTVTKARDFIHRLSVSLHYLHVERQRDEKETRPWF